MASLRTQTKTKSVTGVKTALALLAVTGALAAGVSLYGQPKQPTSDQVYKPKAGEMVNPAGQLPDFVVSRLTANRDTNGTVHIAIAMANQGLGDWRFNSANPVRPRGELYLVRASGERIANGTNWMTPVLVAGASQIINDDYQLPASYASQFVGVFYDVDAYNDVVESNEANNTKSTTITALNISPSIKTLNIKKDELVAPPGRRPDFAVSNLAVTRLPNNDVHIVVTVTNQGNADLQVNQNNPLAPRLGFYMIGPAGDKIIQAEYGMAPIPAGSSRVLVDYIAPASYISAFTKVWFKADDYNDVTESNETNNIAERLIP